MNRQTRISLLPQLIYGPQKRSYRRADQVVVLRAKHWATTDDLLVLFSGVAMGMSTILLLGVHV